MLVRRGTVWSARLTIAGKQVWKSLQTTDFELAVVRLGWLEASASATQFEHKSATHGGPDSEREEEPGCDCQAMGA